jgi:hypothetical protein
MTSLCRRFYPTGVLGKVVCFLGFHTERTLHRQVIAKKEGVRELVVETVVVSYCSRCSKILGSQSDIGDILRGRMFVTIQAPSSKKAKITQVIK